MRTLLAFMLLSAVAPVTQVDNSSTAILWALKLPALVTEARQVGVTETVVRELLNGLRLQGLPADEAALVVSEEVDALKAGEPTNNFGAFVHQQLDAGLRGHALAEAIRAEHRARGIGHRGDGGREDEDRGKAKAKANGRDTLEHGGGGR